MVEASYEGVNPRSKKRSRSAGRNSRGFQSDHAHSAAFSNRRQGRVLAHRPDPCSATAPRYSRKLGNFQSYGSVRPSRDRLDSALSVSCLRWSSSWRYRRRSAGCRWWSYRSVPGTGLSRPDRCRLTAPGQGRCQTKGSGPGLCPSASPGPSPCHYLWAGPRSCRRRNSEGRASASSGPGSVPDESVTGSCLRPEAVANVPRLRESLMVGLHLEPGCPAARPGWLAAPRLGALTWASRWASRTPA